MKAGFRSSTQPTRATRALAYAHQQTDSIKRLLAGETALEELLRVSKEI
ncbi:MAG: hypothetical protein HC877_14105 [Thioploca sp.]|nr:hypothetical protein [Thioploca sp.]